MMQYKGYLGKVEFDDEAEILYGEVIGIRDVITFQADSPKAIEKAFHASVDDYLAFCAERNERPEKPASGKFVMRVSVQMHQQLTMIAQFHGTSLNALVEEFLQKEVSAELSLLSSRRALSPSQRLPTPKSKRSLIKRPGPRQPILIE